MLDALGGQLTSQNKIDEATAVYKRWATHARLAFDKYPEGRASFFQAQVINSSNALASIFLHQNMHAESARAVEDLLKFYAQQRNQSLHKAVFAIFSTRSLLLNCTGGAQHDTTLSAEQIDEAVKRYRSQAKLLQDEAQVVSDRFASQIGDHPNVQGWTIVDACEILLAAGGN